MIAALYVQKNGVYYGLPDVDPWDECRDARNYKGPYPVVAHPPCARWCQLAHINQKRYGHKVGSDGGCFASALASVRSFGGVLEHPAFSYAWPAFGLPRPVHGAWTRDLIDGGWVCQVSQRAYGHDARKLTWLYFFGNNPRSLVWSLPPAIATVSFCKNHGGGDKPRLSKKQAAATPVSFRDSLIAMAEGSNQ